MNKLANDLLPQGGLFLTVGLPLTGKTRFCEWVDLPIVNPPRLRTEVFGRHLSPMTDSLVDVVLDATILGLLASGNRHVIVDACHHTRELRSRYRVFGRASCILVFRDLIEEVRTEQMRTLIERRRREWQEPIREANILAHVTPEGDGYRLVTEFQNALVYHDPHRPCTNGAVPVKDLTEAG